MKIAVFASGNGSNFEKIAEAVQDGEISAELGLLFCDKPSAYVIERAKKRKIPTVSFSPKEFVDKQAYENEILKLLKENNIDWIILAGYMRLVGATLLEAFPKRILNIHPSLLPEFPGLHGIQDAYEAGVDQTGVTVHFVDSGIDTGPIIAQEPVEIHSEDTLEMLEEKIHKVEHGLYPKVIADIMKKNQI